MTNPPSWRPEGPDEAIGLGVVSGGKTVPRPLPGRAMAGLAGAIITALGVAAYVASDFIDADPIETGSIASVAAAQPNESPAAKTATTAPLAPVAVEAKAPGSAKTVEAPLPPAASPTASTPLPAKPAADDPVLAPSSNDKDVSSNLRKQIAPTKLSSQVLAPPTTAEQVAGLAPDVAVAESEAEVAKLEAALAIAEPAPESEVEIARLERAATPSDAVLAPEDAAAMGGPYIPVSSMTATRVTRYVNLRSGPADEANVVAVIPTNATVQAETGCEWCVVTYKDKRGYIYKGFLSGRGGSAKSTGNRSRAAKKLTGKPGLY